MVSRTKLCMTKDAEKPPVHTTVFASAGWDVCEMPPTRLRPNLHCNTAVLAFNYLPRSLTGLDANYVASRQLISYTLKMLIMNLLFDCPTEFENECDLLFIVTLGINHMSSGCVFLRHSQAERLEADIVWNGLQSKEQLWWSHRPQIMVPASFSVKD